MNTDVFGNLFQFKGEAALVNAPVAMQKILKCGVKAAFGERLASYMPVRGRVLYQGDILLLFKFLCHQ